MNSKERAATIDTLTKVQKGLSKTTMDALKYFDECAQHWGYQNNEGVGNDVTNAHDSYMLASIKLIERIQTLEKQAAQGRRFRSALRWVLGEEGPFPQAQADQGPYWWRRELRERAKLAARRGYRG
jgi:hypothetical protein